MKVKLFSKQLLAIVLVLSSTIVLAQFPATVFEQSNFTATATYNEGLAFYQALAEKNAEVNITEMGPTDSGLPLHLVLISKDKDFDIESIRQKGKSILLINNAIHPGEPDGVEASQMLARDILAKPKLAALLDNIVVAIIPFYNIGGVLNRNSTTRTNQNGPEEYGFRGNSRNYDLNRDFIKNDTRNAKSFAEIFHYLDPDVLVDTHVSNGADYQYTLSMVIPQKDKLGQIMGEYLTDKMMPELFDYMAETPYEMTPYVNVWGSTPDKGWNQFFDSPRYSSGYAALFQTIAFQSETHMLKPFDERVWATYYYLLAVTTHLNKHADEIMATRFKAREAVKKQYKFPVTWKIDEKNYTELSFKGYEPSYPESAVTGQERLKYNRDQPFEKTVKYFDNYAADIEVTKPDQYVVPQGWHQVIDRLKLNGIEMEQATEDKTMRVEVYYIEDYSSRKSPWEGHYFHDQVEVQKETERIQVRKGDYMIPVKQANNRYIVETLEPEATDSFFRWNFFDSILQMKEGFSSYIFEDEAVDILNNDPSLKRKFEEKKRLEPDFSDSSSAQLRYIYKNSEHYEKAHLRYPVYRLIYLE